MQRIVERLLLLARVEQLQIPHLVEERGSTRKRKIAASDIAPFQLLRHFECRVEIVQQDCRDLLEPSLIFSISAPFQAQPPCR